MPGPRSNTDSGRMKRPASTTELARIANTAARSLLQSSSQELSAPAAQRRRLEPAGPGMRGAIPGGCLPALSRASGASSSSLLGGGLGPSTSASSQRFVMESTRLSGGESSMRPQLLGPQAFRPMMTMFSASRMPSSLSSSNQAAQLAAAGSSQRVTHSAFGRQSPARPRSSIGQLNDYNAAGHPSAGGTAVDECFCPCKTIAQGRLEGVANRRLLTEMQHLADTPLAGCHVSPREDSIWNWTGVIDGPSDTVYEGGTFFVELNFTERYPFQAPKVVFLTRIYHCNIDSQGRVCMDPISSGWNSCMTISTVMQSLISLLYACNPKDALVPYIAEQYIKHPDEYDKMARIWTQRYAQ